MIKIQSETIYSLDSVTVESKRERYVAKYHERNALNILKEFPNGKMSRNDLFRLFNEDESKEASSEKINLQITLIRYGQIGAVNLSHEEYVKEGRPKKVKVIKTQKIKKAE